jgi:hypothetical protein
MTSVRRKAKHLAPRRWHREVEGAGRGWLRQLGLLVLTLAFTALLVAAMLAVRNDTDGTVGRTTPTGDPSSPCDRTDPGCAP